MAFTTNENDELDRIIVNVGGHKHETYISTLLNIPDTRLAWLTNNVSETKREFFFDRHPGAFAHILNYYRTGKLHCPNDICGPLFQQELEFWGINEQQMEPCCWGGYTQHREAEENLKAFVGPGFEDLKHPDCMSESDSTSTLGVDQTCWQRLRRKIWKILDEPHSSTLAKGVCSMSCFFIALSVLLFCITTLPNFRKKNELTGDVAEIEYIEIICSIWFTVEFIMRFIFCPSKVQFFKQPMTWVDLIAVTPFYIKYLNINRGYINILLVVRLLRLFRFFKLSYGLQILLHTLKASFYELMLLVCILIIPVILFSSVVYSIEMQLNSVNTKFYSVPHSFWWCLITMTTVGYGDLTPETWQGKIVGGTCAICGIIIVALPISVIGNNFNLYYSHARARLKLPKKEKRLVLGGVPHLISNPQELSERRKIKPRNSIAKDDGTLRPIGHNHHTTVVLDDLGTGMLLSQNALKTSSECVEMPSPGLSHARGRRQCIMGNLIGEEPEERKMAMLKVPSAESISLQNIQPSRSPSPPLISLHVDESDMKTASSEESLASSITSRDSLVKESKSQDSSKSMEKLDPINLGPTKSHSRGSSNGSNKIDRSHIPKITHVDPSKQTNGEIKKKNYTELSSKGSQNSLSEPLSPDSFLETNI